VILVEIRCRRRHVLARIEQAPADWSGTLDVPVCARCDSRRPGSGRFIPWARGKDTRPPFTVTAHRVAWLDVRPHVEKAWRTGKTQSVALR
jgi:hypothetical protein